ncbi:MAG: helix-turn-helix domain-containing protein [Bilifractor sp.]|jgi:transcriptional regulator with XRE-family HTH domain
MIGEQIKGLRKANKYTQSDLAALLSVSKQAVSNWENNNVVPSVEQVKNIARLFGCSTDYLLEMTTMYEACFEVSGLTIDQTAHIQVLINDLRRINEMKRTSPEKEKN